MAQFCDLHTHSTYSDGTVTPTQLIRIAEEAGLAAVALTDHNTAAGLPEFLNAAAQSTVIAVPGVEFSTDYGQTELHILALFVKPEHDAAVEELVGQMLLRKEQSNLDLVEALVSLGMELDYGAIKASTPNGQVNRAVIAAEMVRKGYCETVKQAFSRYLGVSCGYFKPPRRLDALETIRFIKSIGAVAVLAHPFLNLDEAGLRQFLREAIPTGLDAMEVYYAGYSAERTELSERIVREFGLLASGGSDFHGNNKPDIRLGTGKGDLRLPLRLLEDLTRRKND